MQVAVASAANGGGAGDVVSHAATSGTHGIVGPGDSRGCKLPKSTLGWLWRLWPGWERRCNNHHLAMAMVTVMVKVKMKVNSPPLQCGSSFRSLRIRSSHDIVAAPCPIAPFPMAIAGGIESAPCPRGHFTRFPLSQTATYGRGFSPPPRTFTLFFETDRKISCGRKSTTFKPGPYSRADRQHGITPLPRLGPVTAPSKTPSPGQPLCLVSNWESCMSPIGSYDRASKKPPSLPLLPRSTALVTGNYGKTLKSFHPSFRKLTVYSEPPSMAGLL